MFGQVWHCRLVGHIADEEASAAGWVRRHLQLGTFAAERNLRIAGTPSNNVQNLCRVGMHGLRDRFGWVQICPPTPGAAVVYARLHLYCTLLEILGILCL